MFLRKESEHRNKSPPQDGSSVAATALQGLAIPPGDLEMLNYALTMEHLAASLLRSNRPLRCFVWVRQSRATRWPATVGGAGLVLLFRLEQGRDTISPADYFLRPTADGACSYLSLIRSPENTHVRSFGATPVSRCISSFSYSSVEDSLRVAPALANTGVMAYADAIAMINSPSIRTTAAPFSKSCPPA